MAGLFKRRVPASGDSPAKPRKSAGTLILDMGGRILYEADASTLADHPIVIGRDKACDWCTSGIDNTISSRHAELLRRRGSVWIRDLGSRNGIQCGGERISERRLSYGDTVLLGACKVSFEAPRREKDSGAAAFHRLEQTNGPDGGRTLELKGDADLVIGSDPACEIFVPDTLVSRNHAKLSFKKDGSCWISDLGSRNGTTVNGTPVAKEKERLLRDGDIISTAYVEFRFLDKNAAHVDAHVVAKLLVAAATVALAIVGYSLWNLARRDAGWYQANALAAAARWTPNARAADFTPAFECLAQADVARQADAYRSSIADTRSKMISWTNTITAWQTVQGHLAKGKWVWAQQNFSSLSSWTWNADSATKAHQEAEAVQELVNGFLSCRVELRRTNWESGREIEAFRKDSALLGSALDGVRAIEGAADRAYLQPLLGEAGELRAEFDATLESLATIPKILSSLAPEGGAEPASDAARRAFAELERMNDEDSRHAAERESEIGSEACPWRANKDYPFHAPIIATRIGEVLEPLRRLGDAERHFEENIAAIAAGSWNSVRNPLEFPKRELIDRYPEFLSYRQRLEDRNGRLCGVIRQGFQSRLETLGKLGFGKFVDSEPSAFAIFRDPFVLASALDFVDGSTPFPQLDAEEPVCRYDSFAGIFETGDFIVELAGGTEPSDAVASYAAAWGERKWKSQVQQVRESLEQLRSFRKWCEADRDGMKKLVLDAAPASGRNNCAAALASTRRIVNDVADWCEEDLRSACDRAGTDRAVIFGDVVALLLASQDDLRKDAAVRRAEAVAARWKKLQSELKRINRDAEVDPAGTWRKIVSLGFPANVAPFKGAWRNLNGQEEK